MRMRSRGGINLSMGLIAVCILALAACQGPLAGWGSGGSAHLSLGLPVARVGTYSNISTWRITGDGPGSAHFSQSATSDQTELTVEALAIGSWTLKIEGLDGAGTVFFTATRAVTILDGDNSVEFTLETVGGLMLGHWDFNAGNAADSTGRTVAVSGQTGVSPSPPTIVAGTNYLTYSAEGPGYMYFNSTGDPMTGSFVDLGSFNFGNQFTLYFWVKPSNSSESVILSNQVGNASAGSLSSPGFTLTHHGVSSADNRIHLYTVNAAGVSRELVSGQTVSPSGYWTHVALTVDSQAGTATLYVNGAATSGSVAPGFACNGLATRVAGFPSGSYTGGLKGYYFAGAMDDWRVYTGLMSPESLAKVVGVSAFGGGSGSQPDPFIVASPKHLHNVRNLPNAVYQQSANIDLGSSPWVGWSPIGETGHAFGGTFLGAGKVISGLQMTVYSAGYSWGLFGVVDHAQIIGVSLYLSGLFVNGPAYAGTSGALAGTVTNSSITDCQATGGYIDFQGTAGGLVGSLTDSSLARSKSDIGLSANGSTDIAGGLVGAMANSATASCLISQCQSTGSITTSGPPYTVGGLVGVVTAVDGVDYMSAIMDSYAGGTIGGSTGTFGGLVGSASTGVSWSVIRCYSRVGLPASGSKGGLLAAGDANANLSYSFWDNNTTTVNTTVGNKVGGTTYWANQGAIIAAALTAAGWSTAIWTLADSAYPVLAWE